MSYYSVPDSEREFAVETPPTLDTDSNYTTLSPYLNFDPSYLPSQPEYIFPYGQRQRGQFEYAFYYIGASCFTGALVGGIRGFVNGLNLTTLAGQTGRIRRTRILNHIMRHGAATSNTLGSIAFLYSSAGVIMSQFRPGDDELNSIFSATLTGLIYKSPGGIRKGLLGSAIGCGLASLYWIISSREKLSYIAEKIPSPSTSSPSPVLTSFFKRDKTEVPVEKEEEEEDLSMK